MRAPVVVGVDGSPQSLRAVDLAAREAALRGVPLRVVHGFIWTHQGVPVDPPPIGAAGGGRRHHSDHLVREAVERALEREPSVRVTGHAVAGRATTVLIEQARSAAMVVVGDHGLGGFTGLLAGSVAVPLAAHAARPVLVARGRPDPTGEVLVGIDGAPASDPAVGFAFEEAALRGAPLTAWHAWDRPPADGPAGASEWESTEARLLAEALAGWHDRYPDVVVRRRLVHARTRRALVAATERAQLVVVGTRGRGGVAGLLRGSVSQAVLHHAACPVAIVPPADRPRR